MTPTQRALALMRGSGLRARLLRGGAGSLLLKMGNAGLTLATAIILARIMGPQQYGVYAFVMSTLMIVAVPVRMGLPILVMRETAGALARGDNATIGFLWRWGTKVVLAASSVVLIVGFSSLWLFADAMDPVRLATFAVGLPFVLLAGLNSLRGAALRGLHHVVLGQLPPMILRPAFLVVGVGFILLAWPGFGFAPQQVVALNLAAAAASFAVGAWLLWQRRPPGVAEGAAKAISTSGWFAAILPLALLSSIQVLNANTDIVMLGLLGADSEVGVYRVAMQGGLLVTFGGQAINSVVMPYFSSIHARGDHAQLQRLVTLGACAITAMSLVVAIIFWVFGQAILTVVFGPEYAPAYVPLCVLAAGKVFSASMGQVGALLSMTGHERRTLRGFLVALACNLVLNAALIPFFGATGAALATALSTVVVNVVLWYSVRDKLNINPSALRIFRLSA